MNRSAATLLVAIVASAIGCTSELDVVEESRDDQIDSFTLEGSALAAELTESPEREAAIPFLRIGVRWDGTAPHGLEFATSVDGLAWSAWTQPDIYHVEMEDIGSFAGEISVPDGEPARFYRLRGTADMTTFVTAEFLELSRSDSIEDGQVVDPDAPVSFIAIGNANVNSRASWGAKAPKCVTNHSPNRMTIHHTVTPTNDTISAQARLRGIQAYHQNSRGWCDIGYQYLISRDGRLWEGRGAHRLGSHVGGANSGNVGISFMGTHDSTSATSTQIESVASLVKGLADRYGISINRTKVKGHREQGNTSCPGNALYAQLGDIVETAKGGGTPPPPPPGTTTVKGVVYEGNDTSDRVVGAQVTLGGVTVTTNSIGYFEFKNVTGSSVNVSASASGFMPGAVTRQSTGATTWASVSLSKAVGNAGLQGVVYRGSSSSNRVPNATITISGGVTINADANGYYSITGLVAGAYTVGASAGGDTGSVQRTAVANQLTWASVRL